MTSQNHPVAMITGGTRGIGSGIYCWYKFDIPSIVNIFLRINATFFYSVIGIAEMFAEEGYDLILGFRENVTAAEKFKTQLLQKYKSQNVKISFFNT